MDKELLFNLYNKEFLSAKEISIRQGCTVSKVTYWLKKHGLQKRTISEAIYRINNKVEPFTVNPEIEANNQFLLGLGFGLFLGEGNMANKNSVRLGNSDPSLVKCFLEFLVAIYGCTRDKFRFGLQIFGDIDPDSALFFWINALSVRKEQFFKTTVSELRGKGTYLKKSRYGVVTLYFGNIKLRNRIMGEIEKLQQLYYHQHRADLPI